MVYLSNGIQLNRSTDITEADEADLLTRKKMVLDY